MKTIRRIMGTRLSYIGKSIKNLLRPNKGRHHSEKQSECPKVKRPIGEEEEVRKIRAKLEKLELEVEELRPKYKGLLVDLFKLTDYSDRQQKWLKLFYSGSWFPWDHDSKLIGTELGLLENQVKSWFLCERSFYVGDFTRLGPGSPPQLSLNGDGVVYYCTCKSTTMVKLAERRSNFL